MPSSSAVASCVPSAVAAEVGFVVSSAEEGFGVSRRPRMREGEGSREGKGSLSLLGVVGPRLDFNAARAAARAACAASAAVVLAAGASALLSLMTGIFALTPPSQVMASESSETHARTWPSSVTRSSRMVTICPGSSRPITSDSMPYSPRTMSGFCPIRMRMRRYRVWTSLFPSGVPYAADTMHASTTCAATTAALTGVAASSLSLLLPFPLPSFLSFFFLSFSSSFAFAAASASAAAFVASSCAFGKCL